jgi:uncharacterized membrane protein
MVARHSRTEDLPMPLFRTIGAWSMERGVDGLTLVVLATYLLPLLPLIIGVGLLYELTSRLDSGRRLSTSAHWTIAVGSALLAIFALAAVLIST